MLKVCGVIALALFACGCVNTGMGDSAAGGSMTHTIVLPAPSDAERASMRPGKKGEPLQVGFGREVPASQRHIALNNLQWHSTPGRGYTAAITVKSTGARSLRAALKLNENVEGLVFVFGASSADVQAKSLVGDVYWSPVTHGDTVSIELKSPTPPTAILEIPTVSHIP